MPDGQLRQEPCETDACGFLRAEGCWGWIQLQIDLVLRASSASSGDEYVLLSQVLQIARGRGFRCAGDDHVFLGTHAALESIRPFLQHAA